MAQNINKSWIYTLDISSILTIFHKLWKTITKKKLNSVTNSWQVEKHKKSSRTLNAKRTRKGAAYSMITTTEGRHAQ